MKTAQKATAHRNTLTQFGVTKKLLKTRKGTIVFSQGSRADAIFFIRTGRVEVTVTSAYGKGTVLRVLGPNDFLGEECLVGGCLRASTATSLEPSSIFRIGKRAMQQALHLHPEFARRFVLSLLNRGLKLKESLCDELLNHSETRLARVLVKLARANDQDQDRLPKTKNLKVTHAALAEMLGASRSRVTFLMNKFRKMGVIDYKGGGGVTVMTDFLTDVVLASI